MQDCGQLQSRRFEFANDDTYKSQKKKLRKQVIVKAEETNRKDKEHTEWMEEVKRQLEEHADEVASEDSKCDKERQWNKGDEKTSKTSASITRMQVIEGFDGGGCLVWSFEYIRSIARIEADILRKAMFGFEFDANAPMQIVADRLEAIYIIQFLAKYTPIPGARNPGDKVECAILESELQILLGANERNAQWWNETCVEWSVLLLRCLDLIPVSSSLEAELEFGGQRMFELENEVMHWRARSEKGEIGIVDTVEDMSVFDWHRYDVGFL